MEFRRFKKTRYVVAFIITLLIFLFGIMLGAVIDSQRVSYLETENRMQQLKYSSLQLQYQYIDQMGVEENCPALTKALEESINDLEEARLNVEQYQEDTLVKGEDFAFIKRDYLINQLRYWLLAKKTKELCGSQIATVLYFYSTDDKCPDCAEQAFVLTYLKKKHGDSLLNFAIDSDFLDEPMVSMLNTAYNVTSYPTIVVNNKVYAGLVSTEQLEQDICSLMGTEKESCQN